MRLCLPLLFGSFAVLLLSACGSADSSADRGFSGNAAGSSGGATPTGTGAASHGAGSEDAPSSAGQGGQAGGWANGGSAAAYSGSSGAAPPVIWNSAKSAAITDMQLTSEYSIWKLAHVEACSNGSSVVVKDGVVVSEGIGYGMLLSAAMGDQALFEGLWTYYQEHLDKNGLMNWTTGKCDPPSNDMQNAATGADLDAAMALVQAAARWPNGGYLPQARALTGKIVQFESDMCSGRRVLKSGDAFSGCNGAGDNRLNPSYFAPGYYKVFARYFTDQAATWTALADGSYQLYALYQARMGGLVPDWSGPDGSDADAGYSNEACRTPFRVAVDYAWTGDTRAKTFLQNVSSWVDANGGLPQAVLVLPNGEQEQNSAFIGAFALAGGYDQGKFDGYMSAWLGATLDDAAYFPGTLRVLYLLVAAGKFSSTM